MSLTSVFLLLAFVFVLLFVGAIKILNTSAGRIFLINLKMRQEEKEKEKELDKVQKLTLEQVKNPDEFLELIMKMKMGERVNIPLAAFSYIYKNLDSFTVFDKDGNLTIINKDKYFEFKEKATNLIKNNSVENQAKIEDIIKKEKDKIAQNPIEITEHEDGTFVKKDYVSRIIEIKKPTDEKILVNMDDNSIILENIEELKIENKEKNSNDKTDKKEFAKQQQQKEKEVKELKQKLKLIEYEKSELEGKLAKEMANDKEENEELETAIEGVKSEDKSIVTEEENEDEIDIEIKKQEVEKDIKNRDKPEDKKVDNKIKETEQNKTKKQKEKQKIKLKYNDNMHFLNQIKHINIADIVQFIVLYDSNSCRKFVVYDDNVGCILINVIWFIYRFSTMLEDENERETFLNTIFTNKKQGFVDQDFLGEIIKKMNHAANYKFGAGILSQEKKDGKNINFRIAKIRDGKDGKLYRGAFLYMFVKNNTFKNILNQNKQLDSILENECSVEITDENANRIRYEDVFG